MTEGSTPQDFSWDDLKVVLAVFRKRSFNGAAVSLQTSQSRVSRRVAALEEALGVRLFERTVDGIVATDAAQRIVAEAELMEKAGLAIARKVSGGDERCAGLVRVAVPDALAQRLLIPRLGELRAQHPDLHLELTSGSELVELHRNEADVALRFVRPESGDFVATKIADLTSGIFAAAGSRWIDMPAAQADWIGWDSAHAHLLGTRWRNQQFPKAAVVLRVSNLPAMLVAVQEGLGIAVLSHSLCVAAGGLAEVACSAAIPSHPLWLVSHRASRSVARIRAVREFLRSCCATLPP